MKTPAAPTKTQAGFFPETDAHDSTAHPAKFHGTDNPRHLRAIAALLRRPQTLRGWACAETFPDGLRPVRVNGRLCWPVAGIKAALGVA